MHFPIHIAIFASGAGSNSQKIIDYFKESDIIKVSLIVCNKPGAGVVQIAQQQNIPVLLIEKERFLMGDGYLEELKESRTDFIVLAGFLLKIPVTLVNAYPFKIINIHPALLPGYGGKNMYGSKVHEAVISAGDTESGITIHYVDELYDNGDIIFQKRSAIDKNETSETLAKKIHLLEYEYYPKIIERVIRKQFNYPPDKPL